MMSILGCSTEELGAVLKALGFRLERRPIKAPPAPSQNETADASAEPGVAQPQADAAIPGADRGDVSKAGPPPEPHSDTTIAPDAVEETRGAGAVASGPEQVEHAVDASRAAQEEVAAASAAATPPESLAGEPANSAAPTSEEEKFEEIWRPRRHRQGERRPPRRDRDYRRGARPDRAADERLATPAASASPGSTPPPAEGAAAVQAGQPAGRDHSRGRERDRERDRDRERERHRKDSRGPQHPSQHRRKGEDRGRGPDRRTPEVISAAPPRGKGSSEADSPFAKLGALREALERRAKEKSSS
jgi:ATP-dependent RNA helicase SUPV3L1/SUV3